MRGFHTVLSDFFSIEGDIPVVLSNFLAMVGPFLLSSFRFLGAWHFGGFEPSGRGIPVVFESL
ncbi:hypothetical protein C1646_762618 [Rhizophagus diaphanus]|nr:hypothetical protein C1646_762618 [Rhizophagus diaphanus] [Rhizophagus sp. MUCL 43196]